MGNSTCPLLGLGDALTCPLLKLVGACLAFVQIGQPSMTFKIKCRIMVVMGAQKRKLGESWGSDRKGLHILGQCPWPEWAGSRHGRWLPAWHPSKCPFTSWPSPTQPDPEVEVLGKLLSYLTHKGDFKPSSNATFSLNPPQVSKQLHLYCIKGNSSNSKTHHARAQRAELLSL